MSNLQEGTTDFRICRHKVCQVSCHATTLKIAQFLRESGILLLAVQWLVETDVRCEHWQVKRAQTHHLRNSEPRGNQKRYIIFFFNLFPKNEKEKHLQTICEI